MCLKLFYYYKKFNFRKFKIFNYIMTKHIFCPSKNRIYNEKQIYIKI